MPLAVLVLSPSFFPRLTCLGAGDGPWPMALWLLELGMEAPKTPRDKGPPVLGFYIGIPNYKAYKGGCLVAVVTVVAVYSCIVLDCICIHG